MDIEDEKRRMVPQGFLPPGGGFGVPTQPPIGFGQGVPVGRVPPTPIIPRQVGTGPSFSPNIRYSPLPGAHHGTADPNRPWAAEFAGTPTTISGPRDRSGGISSYGRYMERARKLLRKRDERASEFATAGVRRNW